MSRLIFLSEIREMKGKIEEEIKYYKEMLSIVETRLSIRLAEQKQLQDLLKILDEELRKEK